METGRTPGGSFLIRAAISEPLFPLWSRTHDDYAHIKPAPFSAFGQALDTAMTLDGLFCSVVRRLINVYFALKI